MTTTETRTTVKDPRPTPTEAEADEAMFEVLFGHSFADELDLIRLGSDAG